MNLMGEICDCELRSHGPKNLNFFSAKTFTKNDFAKKMKEIAWMIIFFVS